MDFRIKILRKYLGLSQEKFSKKIGIKKSSLSLLENGINNPSNQTILLICKMFKVNEHWLRTGKGEMFKEYDNEFISFLQNRNLSDNQISFINDFISLDNEKRENIIQTFKIIKEYFNI